MNGEMEMRRRWKSRQFNYFRLRKEKEFSTSQDGASFQERFPLYAQEFLIESNFQLP